MSVAMNFLRRLPAALTLMMFLGATAMAGDWPQFLGPTRNGLAPGAVAGNWPDAGPPVLWKRAVGQGFAGPVVADGKLLIFHRVDDNEGLDCLDALTGKALWSGRYPTDYRDDFGFDEGPRATPAVADGAVFTFGAAGSLVCWDLASGKPLWKVDTQEAFKSPKGFFGRACSPLVEGDAVIVNVGAGGAGIVAFERKTGKTLWRATDDAAGYSSPIAATFNGKRCILSLMRSGLHAVDAASGKVYFDYPFRSRMDASVNAATPIVADDLIFLSASYGAGATLLQFDPQRPRKIWASGAMANHYATCVYRDGLLFGFDGRQEQGPTLRCIEFKTGNVRWSEENFGAGTILRTEEQLVILTEKGELIVAPASGEAFKPTARAQVLGFECRAYPALANGIFYARDKSELKAIDLRPK